MGGTNLDSFLITTDSGCDLSIDMCKELRIEPLFMSYTMDGTEYTDCMDDAETRAFYQRMREGQRAVTSQITPEQYLTFWTSLLDRGLPIVHIALSSGISGSYNNALAARELLIHEHPQAQVEVVDSLIASAGYGLLNYKAAEFRDAGWSAQDCALWLRENSHRLHAYYTTKDLIYLQRGGRVSRTSAALGTVLNINPILNVNIEGELKMWARARGEKQTFKQMISIIQNLVEEPEKQTLFISHADAPQRAMDFAKLALDAVPFRDVHYSYIGPIIGSHTGPGLISIFFFGKDRSVLYN